MLLALKNMSHGFGAEQIFKDIQLTVEPNDRIGLIGPNGAGKTTLLNLIVGNYEPDAGEIAREPNLKIGYLRQNGGLQGDGTIQSEMRQALFRVFEVESAMLQVGKEIAQQQSHDTAAYFELEKQYQQLEAEFASLDGYQAEVKIATILNGMGFGSFPRDTRVETMSGGERTRLMLCKLLIEQPGLLILDEATNHLDFDMLNWLEDYLTKYRGAIITVSHDRWFLDRVTKTTWEFEGLSIISYPAPYNGYLVLKEQRLERIEKEYDRYCREVERLEDYVRRNIARATTAQSAKSRLRMIEHLEEAPPPPSAARPPKISFHPKLRPVSDVLTVNALTVSVGEKGGEKILLDDFNLLVKRGERLAIIGENGAGKSTLLKTLAERLSPKKGWLEWGKNVRVSFYEQDSGELHSEKTVLEELWDRYPQSTERELRTLVGGLGLTGEEAFKQVGSLSGGERARVKLAILSMEQGNVMLLDEPTNHLDIPAKEALEAALLRFEGTLIIVSHDRWLLSHVPTKIIRLHDGKAQSFTEGFDAMREQLAAKPEPPDAQKEMPATQTGQQHYRSKAQRAAEASAKRQVVQLEEKIAQHEEQKQQITAALADPENASNFQLLSELTHQLTQLEEELAQLYEKWDENLS